jgi:hypothetical protein
MQAIEFAAKISMQGGIALPANLKALYGRDARMILLVDDGVAPAQLAQSNRGERQAKLQQAMADVAQAGTFAQIQDAGAWQHEMREDRAQPGRED